MHSRSWGVVVAHITGDQQMAVSASPLPLSQTEGSERSPVELLGKNPPCSFLCPLPSPMQRPRAQWQVKPVAGQASGREPGCSPLGVDARAVAGGNLEQGSPGKFLRAQGNPAPASDRKSSQSTAGIFPHLWPRQPIQAFLGETFAAPLG